MKKKKLIREVKSAFATAIEMVHPDDMDDERARLRKVLVKVIRKLRVT